MKTTIFLFSCVLMLLELPGVTIAQHKKNCDDDVFDSCAQKVFIYGDRNHRFGRNQAEVFSGCKKSKDAESCVRAYVRRCFKNPLIKQYFSILMRGPSAVLKRSCTKQGAQEIIRHNQCLEASKGALDDCTETAILDMVRVSKSNESYWLSASCW